jgi:hypothetical protein
MVNPLCQFGTLITMQYDTFVFPALKKYVVRRFSHRKKPTLQKAILQRETENVQIGPSFDVWVHGWFQFRPGRAKRAESAAKKSS